MNEFAKCKKIKWKANKSMIHKVCDVRKQRQMNQINDFNAKIRL